MFKLADFHCEGKPMQNVVGGDLFFCGDDLLKRGAYAQNIKKIIDECQTYPKSNDNQSYVIGIDAPWGSGKTHFVSMIVNYLRGFWVKPGLSKDDIAIATINTGAKSPAVDTNDCISVAYYDAWKNDFWDNAFEPLFDQLIQMEPIAKKVKNKDILELGKSAAKVVALGIKGLLAKKLDDIIDSSVLDEISEELKKYYDNATNANYQTMKLFPEFSLFCNAIDDLRGYLKETIQCRGKLVVIIDELDRCKPTFAVQTLEIIKHLFNIEGLVFIFSLDIEQLAHSVRTVYGEGFDAVGYLERFFNYLTMLPRGSVSLTIDAFVKEYGITICEARVKRSFEIIVDQFNLSLREAKTILSSFYVLQQTVLKKYEDIPNAIILFFYFLSMKYKKPEIFSKAIYKGKNNQIRDFVSNHPIPFVGFPQSNSSIFLDAIYRNGFIGEEPFYIVHSGAIEGIDTIVVHKCLEQTLIFTNGREKHITNELSLSMILYAPDFLEIERIKGYRILEHIYRILELCDFCGGHTGE